MSASASRTPRQPAAASLADSTQFHLSEVLAWKKHQLQFVVDNLHLPRNGDTKESLLEVALVGLQARGKVISTPASVHSVPEPPTPIAPVAPPAPAVPAASGPASELPMSLPLSPPPLHLTLSQSPVAATPTSHVDSIVELALHRYRDVVVEELASTMRTFEVRVDSRFDGLQQELKFYKAQVTELRAELSSVQHANAVLASDLSDLQQTVQSMKADMQAVRVSTAALQDNTERAERDKRSRNVVLTGLDEPEGETPQALEVKVHGVLAALHAIGVKVERVSRIGFKPKSYAEAAAGTARPRAKVRPVVLHLSSIPDKLTVLRGRIHLRGSQEYRGLGVNPDLTRQQQERKSATWPVYVKARQDGKKCRWVDDTLYIEGKLFSPAPQ